jgi:hypothetical protein
MFDSEVLFPTLFIAEEEDDDDDDVDINNNDYDDDVLKSTWKRHRMLDS